MRAQLVAAVRAVVVLTVLTGLLYPLVVTGLAQVAFGDKADGSLVRDAEGEVIGSSRLGQTFTGDDYFHGRPSASGAATTGSMVDVLDEAGEPTGDVVPADPDDLTQVNSGPSNLGPTNEDLLATIEERAVAFRATNGLDDDTPVPVDAVTASASGVDPHISVANARLQAERVADERGLEVDEVLALVDDHTTSRSLGFLGEKGVNVLELNLALDGQG